MQDGPATPIAIVNRLRSATLQGKLLWERTGEYGRQYRVLLDEGHTAEVAKVPAGNAVVLTMRNGVGGVTLHLDSGRVPEDLLRLALLQLYVTVRDTVTALVTEEAAKAVKDL
jgi:hypothetical protein